MFVVPVGRGVFRSARPGVYLCRVGFGCWFGMEVGCVAVCEGVSGRWSSRVGVGGVLFCGGGCVGVWWGSRV